MKKITIIMTAFSFTLIGLVALWLVNRSRTGGPEEANGSVASNTTMKTQPITVEGHAEVAFPTRK